MGHSTHSAIGGTCLCKYHAYVPAVFLSRPARVATCVLGGHCRCLCCSICLHCCVHDCQYELTPVLLSFLLLLFVHGLTVPPVLPIAFQHATGKSRHSLDRLSGAQEKEFKRQRCEGAGVTRGEWMASTVLSDREKRSISRAWFRRDERLGKNTRIGSKAPLTRRGANGRNW